MPTWWVFGTLWSALVQFVFFFFLLLLHCLSTQSLGVNLCKRKKRKARKEEIPQDSRARKTKKKGKKLKNYFQDKKKPKSVWLSLLLKPSDTPLQISSSLSGNFFFLLPLREKKAQNISKKPLTFVRLLVRLFPPSVCCMCMMSVCECVCECVWVFESSPSVSPLPCTIRHRQAAHTHTHFRLT